MYIGIDVGGTKIKYGLVDETGKITHRNAIATNHEKGQFINDLVEIINNYQKKGTTIKGIGISAPGIIEKDGYMTTAGSLHALYGTNLKKEIENMVNLPVAVENDANAAAIAENWIGNAQHSDNYLCLVLGTGVGGGIVINGQIYRGFNGMAGEFGWMIVDETPKEDSIETASLNQRGAIVGGLCARYNALKKMEDADFVAVYDAQKILAHEQDDEIAATVIQKFFQDLAIGLINLISCFDPEVILIGGGISENPMFFKRLDAELTGLIARHESLFYLKEKIAPVKEAKLKNDAGLIGAVFQVRKAIKEKV